MTCRGYKAKPGMKARHSQPAILYNVTRSFSNEIWTNLPNNRQHSSHVVIAVHLRCPVSRGEDSNLETVRRRRKEACERLDLPLPQPKRRGGRVRSFTKTRSTMPSAVICPACLRSQWRHLLAGERVLHLSLQLRRCEIFTKTLGRAPLTCIILREMSNIELANLGEKTTASKSWVLRVLRTLGYTYNRTVPIERVPSDVTAHSAQTQLKRKAHKFQVPWQRVVNIEHTSVHLLFPLEFSVAEELPSHVLREE